MALGAAAVALLTSGCGWLQLGANAGRTSFNKDETKLTAATLGSVTQLWSQTEQGTATAPIVNDNTLYVATGATMTAYNATTGAVVWQKSVAKVGGTVVLQAPFWYKGRVGAFYSEKEDTHASQLNGIVDFEYDATTGEVHANDVSFGAMIVPRGFVARGTEFAATATARASGQSAAAVSYGADSTATDNKTGILSLTATDWPTQPMMLGRRVFVSAGNKVFAFDMDSCPASTVLPATGFCGWTWSVTLEPDDPWALAGMPVAIGDDAIAVPVDGGELRVLDAATGAEQWRGSVGTNDRGLAVADGVIYSVSPDDRLYAWNASGCGAATCDPLWAGIVEFTPMTAPVVAGGLVYVGSANHVRAFPV
ncbi:MAG TPA: PQQ-binding-like beta-propeller repeat protein, partial [Acidimicrobiia bacterium]|nr:PQQ-binding-like beta-propeller repeat protein [Acidimicrobiia bacterium]